MKLRINIIGAGKVGQTLGHLFVKTGKATVVGIYNTTIEKAQAAISFIGEGAYYPDIKKMPCADIHLITTPDDVISATCIELCANEHLGAGSVFMHCSGTLTSDVLCAAKLKKSDIASVHPASTFASPEQSVQQFKGTFCAMEGDDAAIQVLGPLFGAIGAVVFQINKKNKLLYHIGCVFAANYLVTLASQANTLFVEAGMDEEASFNLVLSFMRQALVNLEQLKTPRLALTGPIQRGDVATIQSHIQALSGHKQQALYALLGQKTLPLTEHESPIKEMLMDLLFSRTAHESKFASSRK